MEAALSQNRFEEIFSYIAALDVVDEIGWFEYDYRSMDGA